MSKRAPPEVWINDIGDVEVVDGVVRIEMLCTRRGANTPRLYLLCPHAKAPENLSKIWTALQNAPVDLPN